MLALSPLAVSRCWPGRCATTGTAVAALFDAAAARGKPALVTAARPATTAALPGHAAALRDLPVALRHRAGHATRRAGCTQEPPRPTPEDATVLADCARGNADRSGLGQPQR